MSKACPALTSSRLLLRLRLRRKALEVLPGEFVDHGRQGVDDLASSDHERAKPERGVDLGGTGVGWWVGMPRLPAGGGRRLRARLDNLTARATRRHLHPAWNQRPPSWP